MLGVASRPVNLLTDPGFLWTLPNTALGLVAGALTFQWPHVAGGALVFDRGPRGLTRMMVAMNRTAMTIGYVIVSAAPVDGIAIGGTLGRDKDQMRAVIEMTVAKTDTTNLERGYTGQRGQDEQNRRARKAAVQTPGKALTQQEMGLATGGIH